jgi:hydrogenase expression/formation protein HypC
MCVSLPGTVLSLRAPMALIDTVGVQRWCNALAWPELERGDRVLLHAGLVVRVLTEEEAREAEAAFAELGVSVTRGGIDGKQVPGAVAARAEPGVA